MTDSTDDPVRLDDRWRNLFGNPADAPRCGARCRNGHACRQPAIRGKKRCRLHGGLSRGPRTAEGLERMRQSKIVHGERSATSRESRALIRALIAAAKRSGE